MKVLPATRHFDTTQHRPIIKSTRNPLELYKMMKMYTTERKERFPYLKAFFNCIDSMAFNCKMRVIKDEFGNLLAGYTYRLRKNRLEQKKHVH